MYDVLIASKSADKRQISESNNTDMR